MIGFFRQKYFPASRSFLQKISADQNITNSSRILPHITSPLYSRMSVHKLDILHFLHCTMSPLLTRNCFKSNKVRPISNCWFCHLIYKKICLRVKAKKWKISFCDSLTLIWSIISSCSCYKRIICPCRFLLQEHPSQQPGHCALQAQTQTVKANRKFPSEITLQEMSSKLATWKFPIKSFPSWALWSTWSSRSLLCPCFHCMLI